MKDEDINNLIKYLDREDIKDDNFAKIFKKKSEENTYSK